MKIDHKKLSELKEEDINCIALIIARVYQHNSIDLIVSRLYNMCKFEDYTLCLAYEYDAICGVAIYKFDWRMWGGHILYVDTLSAFPTGKGIGKALLNELAAKAARHQCQALQLECRVENEDATRFYKDYGMERRASSFIRRL